MEKKIEKKRARRRLNRKREIDRRWKCHRSTDACKIAHKRPGTKMTAKAETISDYATYHSPKVVSPNKTWKDWLKKILTRLKNTIASILSGRNPE